MVIPGLSRLTSAPDFTGYLDLYDGMLHDSGGGMTATAYVRSDTAQLVVDVTGADPNSTQTAQVPAVERPYTGDERVWIRRDARRNVGGQLRRRGVRPDVRHPRGRDGGRPQRRGVSG